MTRDAYASAQSVNPVAETTDAVVKGEGAGQIALGVVKDIWYLTPAGMVHATGQLAWDLNEALMAASHFPVPDGWVARMVAEGRNPFCALCHDPRGPLSEAARERERARAQFDLSKFENIAGFRNSRSVGINGSTLDEPRVPPTPKSTTLDSHVSGIPTEHREQKPCPNCHESNQGDRRRKDDIGKELMKESFGNSRVQANEVLRQWLRNQ